MQKIQNKTECFLIFYCKRTLVAGAKLANVYVLFCIKNSLFFDLHQFYYYFCTQKEKLIFKDTNHNYIKNTNCWNIQKLQEPRRDVGAFGFHFRFIFFHYAFFFMPLSIFEQNVHFFAQKVYPRSLIFAYLCNQMVCIWRRKLKLIRFSWVYFRQLTELLNL